jgi:hypothetical protein
MDKKKFRPLFANEGLPTNMLHRFDQLLAQKDAKLVAIMEGWDSTPKNAIDYRAEVEKLRKSVYTIILDSLQREWDDIFKDYPTARAKKIAQAEKKAKKLHDISVVYGEVCFPSLADVFINKIRWRPGGIFYDLGSGTGRGIFTALLLHDFDKLCGIELLQGLHEAACEVMDGYAKKPKELDEKPDKLRGASESSESASGTKRDPRVKLVCCDFRDYDWSDGDVVFANSTCFDEDLMGDLTKQCELLKKGTHVITLTKDLESHHFRCVSSESYQMSWGYATVHYHVKITEPRRKGKS